MTFYMEKVAEMLASRGQGEDISWKRKGMDYYELNSDFLEYFCGQIA
jgi:hypothetical protein